MEELKVEIVSEAATASETISPVAKATREIPDEFLSLTPKGGWDLEITFPRTEGMVEATVHQHSDPLKGDKGRTALWLFTADKGDYYRIEGDDAPREPTPP